MRLPPIVRTPLLIAGIASIGLLVLEINEAREWYAHIEPTISALNQDVLDLRAATATANRGAARYIGVRLKVELDDSGIELGSVPPLASGAALRKARAAAEHELRNCPYL